LGAERDESRRPAGDEGLPQMKVEMTGGDWGWGSGTCIAANLLSTQRMWVWHQESF